MADNWQEWISFRLDWTQLCGDSINVNMVSMTIMWWYHDINDNDDDNTSNGGRVCGYHSIKQIIFGIQRIVQTLTNWCAIDQEHKNESTYHLDLVNWNSGLDDPIFLALLSSHTSSYSSSSAPFDLKAELLERVVKLKIISI